MKKTRPVSWIKAAKKDFEGFPEPVQTQGLRALTVATEGQMADCVKPLKGFEGGIMEIVLRHSGDAFRVVYAVQITAIAADFSRIRQVKLDRFTIDRLMGILNRLDKDVDVQITVRSRQQNVTSLHSPIF